MSYHPVHSPPFEVWHSVIRAWELPVILGSLLFRGSFLDANSCAFLIEQDRHLGSSKRQLIDVLSERSGSLFICTCAICRGRTFDFQMSQVASLNARGLSN